MMTVGVDEVGRGSWAGPLVAGAVLLGNPIPGLRDSKRLSPLQRQQLDSEIRSKAISIGLGWVMPAELDKLGMGAALKLAMRRAVSMISMPFDEIIIDGNVNYLAEQQVSRCVVKADDTVPAASAASILAKVARDAYMYDMAKLFPAYAFEHNVGYGTPAHQLALRRFGPCSLHRRSFAPVRAVMEI